MRSGIGLQAELGRHRLLDRYYVPDNQTGGGMFLGEQARWEPMLRLGVSATALR
jgi:hypothetical protein